MRTGLAGERCGPSTYLDEFTFRHNRSKTSGGGRVAARLIEQLRARSIRDEVGRSLGQDRRRPAKTAAKRGQGDRSPGLTRQVLLSTRPAKRTNFFWCALSAASYTWNPPFLPASSSG
jgi:hypothetical protein